MAVGNPYGRNAYGKGPYARATGRPYGVGPYGTGHYSRFAGNTFDVAGRSSLRFNTSAPSQVWRQVAGSTGVSFSVAGYGPQINMRPWAVSSITFTVWAPSEIGWASTAPCELGGWALADLCTAGEWDAPDACSTGTWQKVSLT